MGHPHAMLKALGIVPSSKIVRTHALGVCLHHRRRATAFTLIELLLVLVLVALLVALLVPVSSKVRKKALKVACMSNLRNLYVGTGAYLTDHGGIWPQDPAALDSDAEAKWWISALTPYGITEKGWKCPAAASAPPSPDHAEEAPIHYLPTWFDENPYTAWKWPHMPWFTEAGNFHGDGNLIIRSSGDVMSVTEAQSR